MNTTEDECAKCGSTLEEVRPGKWQCTKCELDRMMADQYNAGYQAGLSKAQRDDDDAFWLRQYAGQAMHGILANNKLLSAFVSAGETIGMEQLAAISKGAVAQATALLDEVKRHETTNPLP